MYTLAMCSIKLTMHCPYAHMLITFHSPSYRQRLMGRQYSLIRIQVLRLVDQWLKGGAGLAS